MYNHLSSLFYLSLSKSLYLKHKSHRRLHCDCAEPILHKSITFVRRIRSKFKHPETKGDSGDSVVKFFNGTERKTKSSRLETIPFPRGVRFPWRQPRRWWLLNKAMVGDDTSELVARCRKFKVEREVAASAEVAKSRRKRRRSSRDDFVIGLLCCRGIVSSPVFLFRKTVCDLHARFNTRDGERAPSQRFEERRAGRVNEWRTRSHRKEEQRPRGRDRHQCQGCL